MWAMESHRLTVALGIFSKRYHSRKWDISGSKNEMMGVRQVKNYRPKRLGIVVVDRWQV